ncbi:MAG TPA: ABC transporter ATP-binding protein [Candidatus Eisenbacteria bacterium]|nr:ABC transporter ATP-binding protein [Candidatus Eisenbacteria bacterium]
MSMIRDTLRPAGAAGSEDRAMREVPALPILRLESLRKTYRDPMTLRPFTAVDEVTLELERGEIFGLLGPNGAGKTTTIKMILGLARPTSGRVLLDGREPSDPASRSRLGYLPENPCFYDHLTPVEYLDLTGALFGIPSDIRRRRASDLLERLGLAAHARKPLRKFSKGMTQRVGLAQALLNEPKLLILDEPMSGLDPVGRSEVKALLREQRARGVTVLMSSHVLAETESICNRVGILKEGRLAEVGAVTSLLQSGVRDWEIAVDAIPESVVAALRAAGHAMERIGSRSIVRVADGTALQGILKSLLDAGAFVHSVEARRETLEDHFVRVLGAPAAPAPAAPAREVRS